MAEMSLADGIDLLQRRAKIVKFLLAGGFVVIAAVLAGQIAELLGYVSLDESVELTGASGLYAIVGMADGVLTLVTTVFFAMWIYRAAANVVAADVAGFAYTPGWAVGWYFIPFANLFKPFSAMRQIWNASHGEQGERLDHAEGLLALWWGCWIASNIASNISFRMTFNPSSSESLLMGQQVGLVASAVSLVLYPAAYRLVGRITEAQRARLNAAHIFA
ncbi:MAG TPA: DUF4328 domain-containing protein [Sphingopyxis sp.]|uniref:DUF4328 domain-containing protein n=1 Tax=Sphingopyxis sp. TaxID=1908224 RepID=UPI002E35D2A1|nr:DUF4328 domain-containing protein [Sphingopyxis sp.]HEX2813372.1 DUF4328 domain-containing protein [Sphingopyxis sp.]